MTLLETLKNAAAIIEMDAAAMRGAVMIDGQWDEEAIEAREAYEYEMAIVRRLQEYAALIDAGMRPGQ